MFSIALDPTQWGSGARQDRQINLSNQQAYKDNAFRENQAFKQEAWNWRMWDDRKFKIQNLVQDAQKAGISPLAALGHSASSPMNISVPSGQGGRVSGTYQRGSPVQMQMSMAANKMAQGQAESVRLQNEGLSHDNVYKQTRNQIELLKLRQMNYGTGQNLMEPLYVPYRDNYDEASRWVEQGYFPIINPQANMEVNESVGSYYFFKPRPEGFYNMMR